MWFYWKSHLFKSIRKKINVIVLDSNINSKEIVLQKIIEIGNLENKDFGKHLKFVKGDIRDISLIDDIFSKALKNKKPIGELYILLV